MSMNIIKALNELKKAMSVTEIAASIGASDRSVYNWTLGRFKPLRIFERKIIKLYEETKQ